MNKLNKNTFINKLAIKLIKILYEQKRESTVEQIYRVVANKYF